MTGQLLRQPGGFEGFGWTPKRLAINDLALLESPEIGVVELKLDTAASSSSADVVTGDNVVSSATRPHDLNLGGPFKRLQCAVPRPLDSIVAPVDLARVIREHFVLV